MAVQTKFGSLTAPLVISCCLHRFDAAPIIMQAKPRDGVQKRSANRPPYNRYSCEGTNTYRNREIDDEEVQPILKNPSRKRRSRPPTQGQNCERRDPRQPVQPSHHAMKLIRHTSKHLGNAFGMRLP